MIQLRLFTIDFYFQYYLFFSFHKFQRDEMSEYGEQVYALFGLEFCSVQTTIYFIFFQFTINNYSEKNLPF